MFKYLNLKYCFGFRISIFGFSAILFLLLAITPAVGQGGAVSPSVGISPPLIREDIKPGEKKVYDLVLTNYGRDTLPLTASTLNITAIDEDGAPQFSTKIGPRSASKWVKIKNPDVVIEKGQAKKVTIEVKAPGNIAPGGYHVAVVFQANLPSYYFDLDAGARILPAVTSTLLLSVVTDNLPTVEDLSVTNITVPRFVVSSPVPVVTEVSNPTQFFIYSDSLVKLDSVISGQQTVDQVKDTIIFPESSRKYITTYNSILWPGVYTATIEMNQGGKILIASSKFIAFPWQFILGVGLILLALIYYGLKRRFHRAYIVLQGGKITKKPTLR